MKNIQRKAGIVMLGIVAQGAHAYTLIECSDGTPMFQKDPYPTMYFGDLTAAEKSATNTAFSRLTYFSDSGYTTLDDNDSSWSSGNGENEIYHNTAIGTADCSYWFWDSPTCDISETDIRLGDEPWYTSEDSTHWPYGTAGRSVQGVMVHEGGHCVGLAHTNNLYNIMGQEWTHVARNGSSTYYGPGEDGSNGLIAIHGERSASDAYRDVGASTWRYSAASGAYSAHKQGRLLNSSLVALPTAGSYLGQTAYQVQPGQIVRMEMTLEAIGEPNVVSPLRTGYYLSTNSIISTGDTYITDESTSMGRDAPFERTSGSITIPAVAPGNYYLGAYVNHDGAFTEYTFANNMAYYPVVVPPPDLIVQSPSVNDSALTPGQLFYTYATARNIGTGASPFTTVLRYYRSTDATITTSDTLIATDSVGSLSVGGSTNQNAQVSAPFSEGVYYVGACVDSVSGESNTSNQCSSGVLIQVAAQPPASTTDAATAVGESEATLNGVVNPAGLSTTVYFDYGTTAAFGSTASYGGIGGGTTGVGVSKTVSGLICNTTYYYRVRGESSAGQGYGTTRTFTTAICPGC